MPRDEARDFTSAERERNQLGSFGRLQNSGLRRGPGGRGGRATGRVGETPQGNNAAVQIEHVTLQAVADQTIAAGGGTVLFDRIAAAPTERRGFRKAAAEIASSGSVGAIPVDVTGLCQIIFELQFYDATTGDPLDETGVDVTLTVRRTRSGLTADWPDLLVDTDLVGIDGPVTGNVTAGDTVTVTLDPSADVIVGGRIYLDVWTVAAATSTVSLWEKVFDGDAWGIHFDGTHWWVTEGYSGLTVSKYDADWAFQTSFETDFGGNRVRGVTMLGGALWFTGNSGGAAASDQLKQYTTAGSKTSEFLSGDTTIAGLTSDGTDLWVVRNDNADAVRFDTSGTQQATLDLPVGTAIRYGGVAFHGGRLWIVDIDEDRVVIYETDGTLVDTIDVSGATTAPAGVWLDGNWLYISEDGAGVWRRRVS